jgi:hypothetical protein
LVAGQAAVGTVTGMLPLSTFWTTIKFIQDKEVYWEHKLQVSEQSSAHENARYEVLAVVLLKRKLLWDVTLH